MHGHSIVLSKEPAWRKLQGAGAGCDLMEAFRAFKKQERERENSRPSIRGRFWNGSAAGNPAPPRLRNGSPVLKKGEAGCSSVPLIPEEVYAFLRRQHSEALALARRESSGTFPVTGAVATAEDIWNATELKGRFPTGFTGAFAAA